MSSWNVEYRDGVYVILDSLDVPIRTSKRIGSDDVIALSLEMERLNVPVALVEGVREIYITYLNRIHGDYDWKTGRIRLSFERDNVPRTAGALIHELGHHVDADEAYSEEEDLRREWRETSASFVKRGWTIGDEDYLYFSVEEYFAAGFEMFYTNKRDLARHPILYRYARRAHSKKVKK